MTSIAALIGIWSLTICTQTSISTSKFKTGYVLENYAFDKSSSYEFTREWFEDSDCKKRIGVEKEVGTFRVGNLVSSSMNPGAQEIDFIHDQVIDRGLFVIKQDNFRVGRSFDLNQRAQMIGLFDYKKK